MKIAAIQMTSKTALFDNLKVAGELIDKASQAGAKLILLPEYFYCMGAQDQERQSLAETYLEGPIQSFIGQKARENQVYLIAGTVPLTSPKKNKFYNSQLIFDPQGVCIGRYDKIHLFSFNNDHESYQESDTMVPGNKIVDFHFNNLRVRPSICYDLRFPEFYRQALGYQLITVPAAFTYTTGKDHWELLLRTRAIENQCYVIASAQTGYHSDGSRTFGHSMIIDPWGNILDCLEESEGFVIAKLDLKKLKKTRLQLPALDNRKLV